ncbi:GMC family oxidoreductase N-terminal domain-containing protein [Runella sp.]|uniref:GMC family oxidoreductase n=1 Tax=Runella sp. TaxID=1960881 RepID=UPI003015931C
MQNQSNNIFDFIVVGSGPSGSILAAKLSENANHSVLLLEAGGEQNNEVARSQAGFLALWETEANWKFNTVPQKHLNNRVIWAPMGKALGGSSNINVGFWSRGAAGDYDGWNKLGLPDWSFKTALDAFLHIENTERSSKNSTVRGGQGAVYMEDCERNTDISDKLLDAFVEVGLGHIGDTNGDNPYVAGRSETIHKNRYRRTIADAFLTAAVRRRPNLTIETHAFASKVLFENNTAKGVEYTVSGQKKTANAKKEVILCAGSINTPKLLMLSGLGPKQHLEELGIEVIKDIPGIGNNLQDHLGVNINVIAPAHVPVPQYGSFDGAAIHEWRFNKTGPATLLSGNNIGFFKLNPDADKPEFEIVPSYQPGFMNYETGQPFFQNLKQGENRAGYSINVIILHPESKGQVTLKSKDINESPNIDPNYFGDPNDLENLSKAVREIQKMTQTNALSHLTEEVSPALTLTDTELKAFIKANVTTVFHPVGTAKMGLKEDPLAVVDNHLKVFGINGLRIADGSVFPTLISGHTMAAAVYAGYQAAKFINNQY